MAHYNSSQSLEGNILQRDDTVEIAGLTYKVLATHLFCTSSEPNSTIFKKLDIPDRHAYCSHIYGYITTIGDWPVFKAGDFKAATKVVFQLLKTWEIMKRITKETQESITKLLPAKCNSVKQIKIQKEITFNKL